ncbi:hypothetical protein Tco_1131006, partial [Tanacetum coccineum]
HEVGSNLKDEENDFMLYNSYGDDTLKEPTAAADQEVKCCQQVIMEYLVKISKKARILELERRHLKMTVLTSYTPYPSRKIRRICACTSQETTKIQSPIRRIQENSIRRIQYKVIKYSGR